MNRSTQYLVIALVAMQTISTACNQSSSAAKKETEDAKQPTEKKSVLNNHDPIDTARYNQLQQYLANGDTTGKWPVKNMPYPLPGALLPFNRIVAFYGNLYSKKMGILGELPKDSMLNKLKQEIAKWQAADSTLPVLPALHYIAVTAQGAPGADKMHRMRMPFHQIDTILNWTNEINGVMFVDIQVGHSSVKTEVPLLEKYLKLPQVHLGIDPEFSMKGGEVPGTKIGNFDASDINDAIDFLAEVVRKNNLPPKILVVHRFTQGMIRNFEQIKKVPEVQIVIDMDGWGDKILKRSTWLRYIHKEPVQYTGFKLFYKNDTKTGADQFYSPEELLQFKPKPIYIQYQ